MVIEWFLYAAGVFTLLLGIVHFFLPHLLDFERAIPLYGEPLKRFKLGPFRYATQRSDVRGIAKVMNHHVSFTLVSIGVMDLAWSQWLPGSWSRFIAIWIALWWFLRAGTQLYVGRRKGDWWLVLGFGLLGLLHTIVAMR